MKVINKYFTILIVLFSFITSSYSQDQIVYLDLDKVLNNTKSGSLILSQLEKSKNAALVKFEKKEAELKKIEDEIKKKLFEFRKEVSNFRQERQKVVNDFNRKKKLEFEKFFKKITPIIENYVAEKNIDILLDKKNIFVANKKKNITQEIIKIIYSKIK